MPAPSPEDRAVHIVKNAIAGRLHKDEHAEHIAKNVAGLLILAGLLRTELEVARAGRRIAAVMTPEKEKA